jgi:hypothetical protein
MAREVPAVDGKCKAEDGKCRSTTFQVSPNDEQMIHITEDFRVDFVDSRIKAQRTANDLLEECKADAKRRASEVLTNTSNAEATGNDAAGAGSAEDAAQALLDDLVKCVEGGVAGTLERLNEEIAFQSSVRTGIAEKLENYTCLDSTLNTTDDIYTTTWHYKGTKHVVHVKHERPASRIHVVEGFIGEEECAAMEKAAEKSLHRATVADGKGGSRLSEHRKAMQAGIVVPWDKEAAGDPIARLSRRVYDYTNHVLGLDIKEHGQEDLMSIQVRRDHPLSFHLFDRAFYRLGYLNSARTCLFVNFCRLRASVCSTKAGERTTKRQIAIHPTAMAIVPGSNIRRGREWELWFSTAPCRRREATQTSGTPASTSSRSVGTASSSATSTR